jgi:hypothetical protein
MVMGGTKWVYRERGIMGVWSGSVTLSTSTGANHQIVIINMSTSKLSMYSKLTINNTPYRLL